MRRKKIFLVFILFLSFAFIYPCYSEDVILLDKTQVEETAPAEIQGEESTDITKTTPRTAEMIEKSAAWPYQNDLKDDVSPQPKQELFRVLISFMKVMLGVVICSIIIFFLALFAKKFYSIPNASSAQNTPDNLHTPNNSDEALKNFLNKTQ